MTIVVIDGTRCGNPIYPRPVEENEKIKKRKTGRINS